jgi:hypothetical protein
MLHAGVSLLHRRRFASRYGVRKIYEKKTDAITDIATAVMRAPEDACRPTAALVPVLVLVAEATISGHCGATSCLPYVEATQSTTPFVHPNPA